MTRPLDVLVIESHPGAAASAVEALEAGGHHIHRCYENSPGFPCRGVIDADLCPLACNTDVALLVRRGVTPSPTPLEQGATCAIRAGVPLVEEGPASRDPYEPFLAARVTDDVVSACEAAGEISLGTLRREILRLVAPVLVGAGMLASEVGCRIEPAASRLHVTFDLPAAATPSVKQALAVRVLDAMRGAGRTYGPVEVSVHDRRAG